MITLVPMTGYNWKCDIKSPGFAHRNFVTTKWHKLMELCQQNSMFSKNLEWKHKDDKGYNKGSPAGSVLHLRP